MDESTVKTVTKKQEEHQETSAQEQPVQTSVIVESCRETELREYVHEGGITIF